MVGALGYGMKNGYLEKEPHPHNYEYQMIKYGSAKARESSKTTLLAAGFTQAGNLFSDVPIFMREIGDTKPREELPTTGVKANNPYAALKEITALAKVGYRYRAGTISPLTNNMGSMEECDIACGGPFEYRSFDVYKSAQLERDLNALGAGGFCVVADLLDRPIGLHLVERAANRHERLSYRVAEANDERSAQEFVNAGERDGYAPIGSVVYPGWLAHIYVILEKASAE